MTRAGGLSVGVTRESNGPICRARADGRGRPGRGGKVAVAFQLRGRQIEPSNTAAGVLAPTGKDLSIRVIDILTMSDGLISEIHMVADELGALAAIDAAALVLSRVGSA